MQGSSQAAGRLLAALEEAGYEVLAEASGHRAYDISLAERGAKAPPRHYLARLFLLSGIVTGEEWGSLSTRVSVGVGRRRPKEVPLLTLGYAPTLDLFAGWPEYDAEGDPNRRSFPVPWRALREAEAEGWAAPLTSSAAYVFRPDRIRTFLDVHRSTREERVARRRGWDGRKAAGIASERWAFKRPSQLPYGEWSRKEMPGAALPPPAEEVRPERAKEVETGFSAPGQAGLSLSDREPLHPAHEYLFWFGIGAEAGGSIETNPAPPPEGLPEGSRLTVVLFPFEEELELVGPTKGELELLADGRAAVTEEAAKPTDDRELLRRQLFFSVRTPPRDGEHRLRCNLYHGSTLLQSRLVTGRVGPGQGDRRALSSDLDYALASVLDRGTLEEVPGHDLSLMVNGGGGWGTGARHEVRFFGAGGAPLVANAPVGAAKVGKAIDTARAALRKASWSKEAEWKEGVDTYRYENSPGDPERFEDDLIMMAKRGFRLYTDIARSLAGGFGGRDELEEKTRGSIRIQITSSEEELYLPAGLFYDHPLDDVPGSEKGARFRLCSEFARALDDSAPLEDSICMKGGCPEYDDDSVVCPSGFWGYRHEIGWPFGGDEPITEIELDGNAALTIGVSTDSSLKRRKAHIERIMQMGRGQVAESRAEFVQLAKASPAHLVYLYCHGGLTKGEDVPFIELGARGSPALSAAYLVKERIRWGEPRPLVFINGCYTTALDPETIGGLVAGFVADAGAVGVVGTEVTVFEPLACAFAEDVLASFLDGSMTIGRAMRRARLELLRERNPLGLVYVPFVAADTRLVKKH